MTHICSPRNPCSLIFLPKLHFVSIIGHRIYVLVMKVCVWYQWMKEWYNTHVYHSSSLSMCTTCIAHYNLLFFIVSCFVYPPPPSPYLLITQLTFSSRCYHSYINPKVVIAHALPSFPLSPNIVNYASLLLPYNPLMRTTTMIAQPPLRPLLPRPIDTIIMSRNMVIRRCLCWQM